MEVEFNTVGDQQMAIDDENSKSSEDISNINENITKIVVDNSEIIQGNSEIIDGNSEIIEDNSEIDSKIIEDIISYLVNDESIVFKSQQRGEVEPNKAEKARMALEIYQKGAIHFLLKFGLHLSKSHLTYFEQFSQDDEEVAAILRSLHGSLQTNQKQVKNRRFEKLKALIAENSYFSEVEMMKRNPLLYDQLIGQYLSEDEKKQRDKVKKENLSFVNVLMEGIERDVAEFKRKQQEAEDKNVEENSSGSEAAMDDCDDSNSEWGEFCDTTTKWGEYSESTGGVPNPSQVDFIENSFNEWNKGKNAGTNSDTGSNTKKVSIMNRNPGPKWGEFSNNPIRSSVNHVNRAPVLIIAEERALLRNEFTSLMYQSFLDGKDDFDYESVDNDESYDNLDIVSHDEEDKYFDSEEPEFVNEEMVVREESSEDELDIYMNALNQHPAVCQLSNDLKRL